MKAHLLLKIFGTISLLLVASGALADQWQWTEDNWDAQANVVEGKSFMMVFRKGGETATAQGTMERTGPLTFLVHRQKATDVNARACEYTGKFEADGKQFSGTYTCTPGNTNFPFSGTVLDAGQNPSFTVCKVTWFIAEGLNSDFTFEGSGATKDEAVNMARSQCVARFPGNSGQQAFCHAPPKIQQCN